MILKPGMDNQGLNALQSSYRSWPLIDFDYIVATSALVKFEYCTYNSPSLISGHFLITKKNPFTFQ